MYKDTPLKRSVRELKRDWQPIFGGSQVPPPFKEMQHVADHFDDTEFADTRRYYAMPEKAPTGGGLHHPDEDRETSHFVGKVLESIHPDLATLYRGGAINDHKNPVATNQYRGAVSRIHPIGGAHAYETQTTGKPRYTRPRGGASRRTYSRYRPREIFRR